MEQTICPQRDMEAYPESHAYGLIEIINVPDKLVFNGDIGIQIADDGRMWICRDGIALIRFKPERIK